MRTKNKKRIYGGFSCRLYGLKYDGHGWPNVEAAQEVQKGFDPVSYSMSFYQLLYLYISKE